MRTVLTLLFVLIAAGAQARTVTDSAGRKVDVPDKIEGVFAAGPPASILLYMLAPEKMTGWPDPPRAEERPFIAEKYRDLPALGRLTGRGGTANLEVVLKTKPDLILDFGSVRDTYVSLADNVQAQTSIPYILIDGRFDATPVALRLLDDILGLKERGEEMARYVEATFREIDTALATTPEEKRPRVYLARGPDGLETGVAGSINTEIIERAGARNVAQAVGQKGISQGRASRRSMSWIIASLRYASAVAARHSKCLARRRLRPIQASVRSTTQRRGSTSKPLAVSERFTISSFQSPMALKALVSLWAL